MLQAEITVGKDDNSALTRNS